jgi:hypothetical protein
MQKPPAVWHRLGRLLGAGGGWTADAVQQQHQLTALDASAISQQPQVLQ